MYADIIVDISFEKLDRIFQYRIPEALLPEIEIGTQVRIPFGKADRRICGYVVGLSEKPDYPEAKIKSLLEAVPKSTAVESKLIQLAWWIRDMYGSTMNQALKTVVPVKKKVQGKNRKYIELQVSREEAWRYAESFEKKSKAKARLLKELLDSDQKRDLEEMQVSPSVVKALEELSIIRICTEGIYRNPLIYEKGETDGAGQRLLLTDKQQEIADELIKRYREGDRKTSLLHGITGSGKTEVYMEVIEGVLQMGKQAIFLIPEIALTYQMIRRFYARFGEQVSVMNSRMSQGERYDQFERAKRGEIDIMIGPRSALFTPFGRLGLIIMDEEHEGSYKSENVPKYHARETAEKLAELTGAMLLLGSATPSMEAYHRALSGRYCLYELSGRVRERKLPVVYTVDLREELKEGNKTMFSRKLKELMEDRLLKKEQIMLFINRRGYAGFVSCRSCGITMRCPHCEVSLTYHAEGMLRCHYCGYSIPMPSNCPQCGSKYIAAFGTGTQKVEAAVQKEFPEAGVLRMDMDTTSGKDGHEKILSAFASHQADILIGTQMIVKGHDFPAVTLVGVIAADLSLHAADYRASERTFQLLTQASGRAGRGEKKGEVVIQTYSPEHYSIETAARQDYKAFYEQEILYRRLLKYPPAGNMMVILLSSSRRETCREAAGRLLKRADELCKRQERALYIIGPADASIAKIKDIYRTVLYIRQGIETETLTDIRELKNSMESFIKEEIREKELSIQFDINPMNSY